MLRSICRVSVVYSGRGCRIFTISTSECLLEGGMDPLLAMAVDICLELDSIREPSIDHFKLLITPATLRFVGHSHFYVTISTIHRNFSAAFSSSMTQVQQTNETHGGKGSRIASQSYVTRAEVFPSYSTRQRNDAAKVKSIVNPILKPAEVGKANSKKHGLIAFCTATSCALEAQT